jgi:RNA 2',3'-cyclic 3'-phosphodiesterase
MRLFVAVTPPASALDEIDDAVAPLRASWPQLRWTDRPTWHLTMAFLGEVDEAAAEGLGTKLQDAAAHQKMFEVALSGAGVFPEKSTAHHVFWAGVADADEKLKGLAGEVAEAAKAARVPPPEDHRGFKPHLTLARCRAPACLTPLQAALAAFQGTPWPVTEILLARSYLRPERLEPRYERLGQWPLCAATAVL